MKTPCKACTDRELGCHSQCDSYRAFRKACIELNRKKKEDNMILGTIVAGNESRHKRYDKSVFKTHIKR